MSKIKFKHFRTFTSERARIYIDVTEDETYRVSGDECKTRSFPNFVEAEEYARDQELLINFEHSQF
jgi:hypothetical protein